MPEKLEKKVINEVKINFAVYRFAAVIVDTDNSGVLAPFIRLLLEQHHTLIVAPKLENEKPAAMIINPPAAPVPAPKFKLNPKVAAFVPSIQKPAAFFQQLNTANAVSSVVPTLNDEGPKGIPPLSSHGVI